MKNLMIQAVTLHRLAARLAAIVLFAVLLSAAPFHAALAATAPVLGTASTFAVLSAAPAAGGAVTLTTSTVNGDVGSSGLMASVVQTGSTITGAIIAPVPDQVLTDFLIAYDSLAWVGCDYVLSGDLGGVTLSKPGVYCVDAASSTTNGTLTLSGSSTDTWIFKIGTSGTGALTGTNFTVVMAGGGLPCNVYWWVAQAATMTDSAFQGTILAGAAITVTGGTFNGDALAKAGVTLTGATVTGCGASGGGGKSQSKCNQGVGNGPENCDPGNSNQGDLSRSNDELVGTPGVVGTPGNPGRKGGNGK
jgi:hypothetical protein